MNYGNDDATPYFSTNYNNGDYTTQRTTTQRTTTQRTTTQTPYPSLVFEGSNYFTQGLYQTRPTSRPTIRTTRTTTTRRTTPSWWAETTPRPQQGSSLQGSSPQSQQGISQNTQNQNCYPSITTVNKRRINCKDSLIFEEQFEYNFHNRWSPDIRMPLEIEVNKKHKALKYIFIKMLNTIHILQKGSNSLLTSGLLFMKAKHFSHRMQNSFFMKTIQVFGMYQMEI